MIAIQRGPNVVEACARDGLEEKLGMIAADLKQCSVALDAYLESKCLIFPRFYFLSKDDLLDILANGNHPDRVVRHLFKLFDNLKRVDFAEDADGNPTKNAVVMYSKEGERVELVEPCACVGSVEVWLNDLVDVMRKTLRAVLADAVDTHNVMSRPTWIDHYPAQIVLTGSQIWHTTAVEVWIA